MNGSSLLGEAPMLVGRDDELELLEGLLIDARRGRSAVRIVHGGPGVGKTALLDHLGSRAEGFAVLRVAGAEFESRIPLSGLDDLVRPLQPWLEAIPEPQAAALGGALALGPPPATDRFTVAAGLLSLLAARAEGEPLLVIIDDAHWIDAASAEFVVWAARRLEAERIVLLLADGHEPGAFVATGLPTLELEGLDRVAGSPAEPQEGVRY